MEYESLSVRLTGFGCLTRLSRHRAFVPTKACSVSLFGTPRAPALAGMANQEFTIAGEILRLQILLPPLRNLDNNLAPRPPRPQFLERPHRALILHAKNLIHHCAHLPLLHPPPDLLIILHFTLQVQELPRPLPTPNTRGHILLHSME